MENQTPDIYADLTAVIHNMTDEQFETFKYICSHLNKTAPNESERNSDGTNHIRHTKDSTERNNAPQHRYTPYL